MIRQRLLLLALCFVPSIASAHPGHGTAGGSHGWVHYLTDPMHMGVLVTAVLALACLYVLRKRSAATQS